jgi:hypothetical protein
MVLIQDDLSLFQSELNLLILRDQTVSLFCQARLFLLQVIHLHLQFVALILEVFLLLHDLLNLLILFSQLHQIALQLIQKVSIYNYLIVMTAWNSIFLGSFLLAEAHALLEHWGGSLVCITCGSIEVE